LTVLYQQIVDVVHLMCPVVEHKITTAKHFMYPEQKDLSFRDALNIIRPEHVAFGSGAASLLSNLALSLAEEGDAVLIPAPVSCM
jgi:histidinol-phosphate/aromatic aminotransferase/cobyric acid decarboxylase-like protein